MRILDEECAPGMSGRSATATSAWRCLSVAGPGPSNLHAVGYQNPWLGDSCSAARCCEDSQQHEAERLYESERSR